MSGTVQRIIFAGGGTGGTIGPGLAIAERLADLAPEVESIFLCSDRAIDQRMLEDAGFSHLALPARPFSARPIPLLRFLSAWRATRKEARSVVMRSQRLVSLGGFVAPPVAREARAQGVPITLLNLDARIGKATRHIIPIADDIVTAVQAKLPGNPQPIGVPLRKAVLSDGDRTAARTRLGLDPDRPTLLITGASQGAASLNRFMTLFASSHASQLKDWQVLHLAGRDESADQVRDAYQANDVSAVVMTFLDVMADAWGAADLVISRGGASSIAEIEANGVPAIIVPYPYHKDLHQAANARGLVAAQGAVLVDDKVDPKENLGTIGSALVPLLGDETERSRMAAGLRRQPRADAAELIARRLLVT